MSVEFEVEEDMLGKWRVQAMRAGLRLYGLQPGGKAVIRGGSSFAKPRRFV